MSERTLLGATGRGPALGVRQDGGPVVVVQALRAVVRAHHHLRVRLGPGRAHRPGRHEATAPAQPRGRLRPRRGRPGTSPLRGAVHGYAFTTIEHIAAPAKVGRGALYRRWSSKAEIVFARLVHPTELGPPPDTGSLRGDLEVVAGIVREPVGRCSFDVAGRPGGV